jgi:methionyl-tRNA formyltransferase
MKTVFLCGHKSPYGRAHLKPILESKFEVLAIVLATNQRWALFRSALSGKPVQSFESLNSNRGLKKTAKHILAWLPGNFDLKRRALHSLYPDRYPEREIDQYVKDYGVIFRSEFDINSETFMAWAKSLKPDLIISAAYPQIFGKTLLEISTVGSINSHPSLLPRCRGAHPIFWAIASGEKRSGLTAHYMTESLDDGDIIAQRGFDLEPSIRYRELYNQIIQVVPNLVEDMEDFLLSGERKGRSQDDNSATYFKNDREIHRRIFFSKQTALETDRLVRACDGNASFFYGGELIRVIKAAPHDTNPNLTNNVDVPAGTVVDLGQDGAFIKAKAGIIELIEILAQGRKLSGANIGHKLGWKTGMVIGK